MNQGDPPARPPHDLQGLLRICVANTSTGDDPSQTHGSGRMDQERREWLQEALNSLTGNSVVDEMIKCLEVLKGEIEAVNAGSATQDTYNKQESALETLMDHVGSIDYANDFHKIGGFPILNQLLKSPNPQIRAMSASLVAELVQNNPYCQKAAMDEKLLPILVEMLDQDVDDVKTKAIYALSCLCRDHPEAQVEFELCDGFSVLLRAMQSPMERLRVKASVMMTSLCRQQPTFRDTLCSMGFVEQLAALIQTTEHDHTHEYLVGALWALVSEHQQSVEECRRPELGLEQVIRQRLEMLKEKPEFLEEHEYCSKLADLCFNSDVINSNTLVETMDR